MTSDNSISIFHSPRAASPSPSAVFTNITLADLMNKARRSRKNKVNLNQEQKVLTQQIQELKKPKKTKKDHFESFITNPLFNIALALLSIGGVSFLRDLLPRMKKSQSLSDGAINTLNSLMNPQSASSDEMKRIIEWARTAIDKNYDPWSDSNLKPLLDAYLALFMTKEQKENAREQLSNAFKRKLTNLANGILEHFTWDCDGPFAYKNFLEPENIVNRSSLEVALAKILFVSSANRLGYLHRTAKEDGVFDPLNATIGAVADGIKLGLYPNTNSHIHELAKKWAEEHSKSATPLSRNELDQLWKTDPILADSLEEAYYRTYVDIVTARAGVFSNASSQRFFDGSEAIAVEGSSVRETGGTPEVGHPISDMIGTYGVGGLIRTREVVRDIHGKPLLDAKGHPKVRSVIKVPEYIIPFTKIFQKLINENPELSKQLQALNPRVTIAKGVAYATYILPEIEKKLKEGFYGKDKKDYSLEFKYSADWFFKNICEVLEKAEVNYQRGQHGHEDGWNINDLQNYLKSKFRELGSSDLDFNSSTKKAALKDFSECTPGDFNSRVPIPKAAWDVINKENFSEKDLESFHHLLRGTMYNDVVLHTVTYMLDVLDPHESTYPMEKNKVLAVKIFDDFFKSDKGKAFLKRIKEDPEIRKSFEAGIRADMKFDTFNMDVSDSQVIFNCVNNSDKKVDKETERIFYLHQASYFEMVAGKLEKLLAISLRRFHDKTYVTAGDSPSDATLHAAALVAHPTAWAIIVRNLTNVENNLIPAVANALDMEVDEGRLAKESAAYAQSLKRTVEEYNPEWYGIEVPNAERQNQLFGREIESFIQEKSTGKFILADIKGADGEVTEKLPSAVAAWKDTAFASRDELLKQLSVLHPRVQEFKDIIEKQVLSNPLRYKVSKNSDGTYKSEIVGGSFWSGENTNPLLGHSFVGKDAKTAKQLMMDFLVQKGYIQGLFTERSTQQPDTEPNIMAEAIVNGLAAQYDPSALAEILKNPDAAIKELKLNPYQYQLGGAMTDLDIPSEFLARPDQIDSRNPYHPEHKLRLFGPAIAQRTVAAGSILAIIGGLAVAIYHLKTLFDKKSGSSSDTQNLSDADKSNLYSAALNGSQQGLTDPNSLGQLSHTLIDDLTSRTMSTGFFLMNLGFLIRNLFCDPTTQPLFVLGNLVGMGSILAPAGPIQNASIVASLGLGVSGWFNRYVRWGKSEVFNPVDWKHLWDSMSYTEKDLAAAKVVEKETGKLHFDGKTQIIPAYEYTLLDQKRTQMETWLRKNHVPGFLADTLASLGEVGYACTRLLTHPRLAKDALLNFEPKKDIVRGEIIRKPHIDGYWLAVGGALPLISLAAVGIYEGVRHVFFKEKPHEDGQQDFDEQQNLNPSNVGDGEGPLKYVTSLFGAFPGIATIPSALMVRSGAFGDPLTASMIGTNQQLRAMPGTNSNLMIGGGLLAALGSVLSCLPSVGPIFGGLFAAGEGARTLGFINYSMIQYGSAQDKAAQGRDFGGGGFRVADARTNIANLVEAEQKGWLRNWEHMGLQGHLESNIVPASRLRASVHHSASQRKDN
jgi:hypothetical protein